MTKLRVLYVDDDDDIRTIASMSLRIDPGLDVRAASSGQDALAMLDSDPWRPEVILLDVMMPEMDGFAVLAAMRAREDLRDVRAIFMTARASRAGLEDYFASGADGVILKPFDPMSLSAEVRDIVGRSR